MLGQHFASEIFHGKNQAHISQAPGPGGLFAKQPTERGKDGGASIDGKHPQRSVSHQSHVPAAEGVHGGKNDFHAPADETAFEKVFYEVQGTLFHKEAPLG